MQYCGNTPIHTTNGTYYMHQAHGYGGHSPAGMHADTSSHSCVMNQNTSEKNWFKTAAFFIFRIVFLFLYFIGLLVSVIAGVLLLIYLATECFYSSEASFDDSYCSELLIVFAISVAVTFVSYVFGMCCVG
ncbi:uncharacterized protein VICG_01816 [Vittaforma corneae ATCC 50505]|uniref:Uncharacterized protein n=1 Tax=Vittaforma corneae (strain ATCC 50505) TaxID=993615 RepID=L2GLG9_VITCO|nr:uncharacterized protein VICG_01816 [Vittaforma corneae ATCC 50505]ELA41117.1 hypothetical protein VICG_01816 [Vittaforma corneae ATCC 50505]